MNIAVCVKQVIDTEAVIELDDDGGVVRDGQTFVIDPYSEFAVEKAIQLKEQLGGEVTIVTVGDAGCATSVRHALAMGADKAIIIEDDTWFESDASVRAAYLAEVIAELDARLVMGGWKSGDTANAQTMGRVAAILGIPLANMATELEVDGEVATVACELDDGIMSSELTLPIVVAAQQGLAEPRYPTVRDVMQARRKPLEIRPAASLAQPEGGCSVRVVSRELKPARSGGRIIEGTPEESVAETVRLLKDEAKVL